VIDKQHRLTSSVDFRNARNSGRVYKHPFITVIVSPNSLSVTRIGIIAGKHTGGAVLRNLIKRRLRACMQEHFSSINNGWDILLIARQQSGQIAYSELSNAALGLLVKAGVMTAG
jgi:ribonuclease P protein component